MNDDYRFIGGRLTVLATAIVLAACGGDKPEALLGSAKEYLAKNDPKAAVIQIKNALQKDPGLAEGRFLLGKTLLDSGDPVGAEVELRKAMADKYQPDQVVPLLAQSLLASGQARKLLTELQAVSLSSFEAKADLQTSIATAQLILGQTEKARASLAAAFAIKPDYPPTMVLKARMMLADQDVTGALKLLDAVIEKDARNHEAWKLKGDILMSRKENDQALSAYRKAVEIKPDLVGAHVAIISALIRDDKLDEAGSQLELMKKALPKNPQTSLAEAEYRYYKKEFKGARDAVQEVLRVAPNHPKALMIAGATEFQLNELGQAEEYLSKALKEMPAANFPRRLLAITYLRTGQPAKALATIEPLLAEGGGDSGLQSLAGDIYMQNGNTQKAEDYFAKAAALDPKNAGKQTKVALTHLAEGKTESAFGELERIASSDSGTSADTALISAAIRAKDYAKAMKAVDGLEKKQPDNPLTHLLRGMVFLAKGDIAAGRNSLEKALALKPSYFPAAAGLAGLDLKEQKIDDARKRFESVLAADPKSIQAGLALAELKMRTGGSPDEVEAMIAKTIQANPTEPTPRLALIGLHLKQRNAKKAVAAAQEASAAIPDSIEILDALGRAQQAAGDNNQALAAYGKMSTLTPGSPRPYLRMAEISLAAGAKDEAIRYLRKALDLQPDLLLAQRGLITLYLGAGNVSEAQKLANDVRQQRPKESVGYLFQGDIAAFQKDWPAAIAAYKAGLKQVSATELAVKAYAALRASGNGAEAEKFATGWLNDHAQDVGFRMAVAESYMARKDYSAAVKLYQAMLSTQPNNPAILNNLAWALGQLKDARALDYAEKAYRLAPNQAAVVETLGSLLLQKGDVGRGLELLSKAQEMFPESMDIKLSLARAQIKAGKRDEAGKALKELSALGSKFARQAEVTELMREAGN